MPIRTIRVAYGAVVACAFVSFSSFSVAESALTKQQQALVIEGTLARIREKYVEPNDVGTIEKALRSKAVNGEYRAASSPEAFASQIQEDLRKSSGDPHFRVEYVPGEIPPLPTSLVSPPQTEAEHRAKMHIEAVISNNGFARAEYLEGNVGLLELTKVSEPAMLAETAAAAMSFVKDTNSLIVDLRRNRGGVPDGVAHMLSYFVEGRRHAFDLAAKDPKETLEYFTDPEIPGPRYANDRQVFVLTSSETFSGGEALVDGLRTLRHAKIIGERTKGGANATLPMKATEHFIIAVPFLKTVNAATGKNWNDVGIEPDVTASADSAQEVAYQLALKYNIETTKSDAWREHLKVLLNRRQSHLLH